MLLVATQNADKFAEYTNEKGKVNLPMNIRSTVVEFYEPTFFI